MPTDIQTHKTYLQMCVNLTKFSKCIRNQVGCMLIYEGRIISTGVNGSPKGHINCCDHFKNADLQSEEFKKEHSVWSLKHEIHAELNAILYARIHGTPIPEGTVLYCTHEPCDNCLKHIAGVGIKDVYYAQKYYNNITENTFKLNIHQIEL